MLQPALRLDAAHRPFGATLGSYVRLTKPRVIELLLVTAVPPMVLAEHGIPSLWLVLAVVVGGGPAAGGGPTTYYLAPLAPRPPLPPPPNPPRAPRADLPAPPP